MYAKELEVRLSCSYGVGRYDPAYELTGMDYPLPYVRWTERRNLEFFLTLLAEKRLQVRDLASHQIAVEEAGKAYALIKSGSSETYGVLLDYHLPPQPKLPENPYICNQLQGARTSGTDLVKVGLIGIGGYAKNVHLPNLKKIEGVVIRGIASRSGASAAVAVKKAGAAYATSDIDELLRDKELDAVVISTRHATHAGFVLDALSAGKHVFVEKPMAITLDDCKKIVKSQQTSKSILRVGFNRRFAPFLRNMKQAVGHGKKLLNIRVNVGAMGEHWSNTSEEGGRLLGEGVHFFDLANWIMDAPPVALTAQFAGEPDLLNPDASVSIRYENGSVANIVYTTMGHVGCGKEYFELFANGRSLVMNDYKTLKGFGCHIKTRRKDKGNKGQLAAMEEFIKAVRAGSIGEGADALAGLMATAMVTAAVHSAETGQHIILQHIIMNT
jgi:predicted dehydrogenase